jgi:hypothetical protein
MEKLTAQVGSSSTTSVRFTCASTGVKRDTKPKHQENCILNADSKSTRSRRKSLHFLPMRSVLCSSYVARLCRSPLSQAMGPLQRSAVMKHQKKTILDQTIYAGERCPTMARPHRAQLAIFSSSGVDGLGSSATPAHGKKVHGSGS